MDEQKNLVFLNTCYDEKNILLIISDAITKGIPNIFYIHNKNNLAEKLTTSQLNQVRNSFPHDTKIIFTPPTLMYGNITDFGRWQYVGIKVLLARKQELQIYNCYEIKNTHIKVTLIDNNSCSTLSADERDKKYKDIALQVMQEFPHIGKEEVAEEIIDRLRQSDPKYLLKPDGSQIKPSTLLNRFKMIKTKR